MNFFTARKNVSFSRYLGFCVFEKSTNFKIYDVIIDIDGIMEVTLLLISSEC